MSFLQPWMLFALPLMGLPILIHLIHQRRYRSVDWAAMMFLVRAERMSTGLAKLRYLLIMMMRMSAIGLLVFAISRPLASGRLGSAGVGGSDATLILLDRSASMETGDAQSGASRRSTALAKLAELLGQRGHGSQLVLIDSATGEVSAIDSPAALTDLQAAGASATSADIPAMLERGLQWLEANEAGRVDVWICSDLHANDWDPTSGRWPALRAQLAARKGVHFYVLSYAAPPVRNVAVRVSNVTRRQRGSRAELVLDVHLRVTGPTSSGPIPVEFAIGGVRSVVELEPDAGEATLQGHRIPLDGKQRSGWGSVSVPADANPQDNTFYFVFAEQPARHAVVVTDDPLTGEAFRCALAIPSEPGVKHSARVMPVGRASEIDWDRTGLVVWQAPLPSGAVAEQLERLVDAGRVVLFFPPGHDDGGALFASRWDAWQPLAEDERKVSWWRADADLLAHAGSGDALPLDELLTFRYCAIRGTAGGVPGTPLARLGTDRPLLVRAPTDRGGVYFCSTLPTAKFSSLEQDGVAFYVMLQRALAEGSSQLSTASMRDAKGGVLAGPGSWNALAHAGASGVSERGLHAGVYEAGEIRAAVNRSRAEDEGAPLPATTVDGLFDGLVYQRIDDAAGDTSSLAAEIWRLFLIVMVLALIGEAALCLPGRGVRGRKVEEAL